MSRDPRDGSGRRGASGLAGILLQPGQKTGHQIADWFLPDDDQLIGSVLCLARQPVGTIGLFILFPAR